MGGQPRPKLNGHVYSFILQRGLQGNFRFDGSRVGVTTANHEASTWSFYASYCTGQMNMTPEEAQSLYYQSVRLKYREFVESNEPVKQRECDLAGFKAVIDAVRKETDIEWATKLTEK